ncbi:M56 family metallopeptidase [Amycolatopsis sp. H20-H5]|uniref:M56 family metallopeptidase n=1 Tax=Amycolatopsis sp. H20-H5 TaxID=3046309 RepID=UPI002DB73D28|nr:M56 family metallopeptidase [Amycolatopsis sp. H20-H5]MEC3974401.1 M56 family metallopeptidase [Amycolatopsis sp. H20-H5]
MTATVALLLGALTVGWLAPALLGRLDLTRIDPLLALTGWLLSTVGVVVAATAGIVLVLVPGHGGAPTVFSAVHGCWTAISHGTPPRTEELVGLLGGLLLVSLALRFAVIIVQGTRRQARTRTEYLSTLRVSARFDPRSPTVWWLDHDKPLAFSVAHRRGIIVATDGLARHLATAEVAAVLAHEYAHLRGRHHLLISWVDALSQALPVIPLFRRSPAAMRELVELTADVAAARECGSDILRSALAGVGRHSAPDDALAMARDAVSLRLARLTRTKSPSGRFRRGLSCGLAAVIATALPALTGVALVSAIALVACPFTGS